VGSRLTNVRLDADRRHKAQQLRERGVSLSDVLRQAIDERWSKLSAGRDVAEIITQMFEQYPDPPDLPPRAYDVHDRRAARDAIVRRLHRRRRTRR
jgi:hypothetical protein